MCSATAPLPGVLVLLNESRGFLVRCVPHPSHRILVAVPPSSVAHFGLGLEWVLGNISSWKEVVWHSW